MYAEDLGPRIFPGAGEFALHRCKCENWSRNFGTDFLDCRWSGDGYSLNKLGSSLSPLLRPESSTEAS